MSDASVDLEVFGAHRAHLIALAYRMLGELGRAEEIVQDAWLRWSSRDHAEAITSPRAYLVTLTTRLCLNELASARRQREESRGDRLPEPIDLAPHGLDRIEAIERVSMAFLVALQRLTPAERAVLLLHDVFDFEHAEIATLIGKSDAACRQLLSRAKESLAEEKRMMVVSRETHDRLLRAFLAAAYAGDTGTMVSLLADDASIITDGGAAGRVQGGFKNLDKPLVGALNVAAFVASATKRGGGALSAEVRDLNGLPGVVLRGPTGPFGAITLAVSGDRIQRVYFHADLTRLDHLGTA